MRSFAWPALVAADAVSRERVSAGAVEERLGPGAVLMPAGSAAGRVTLLVDGVVRVFHALSSELQFTVKLLRAPDAVGLVEALRGSPRVASVEALTDLSVIHLPAALILERVRADHAFALAVLEDLAGKFEGTIRAMRSLGFDDCETRLVRVLLEYGAHFGLAEPRGVSIRYPLPRERLARETGSARRSIDRALLHLRGEDLVELSAGGWLVLRNQEALQQLIAPPQP